MTNPTTESPSDPSTPWEMERALKAKLIRFTIDLTSATSAPSAEFPTKQNNRVIQLRNSVIYRFESVAYHCDLVDERERRCFSLLCRDPIRRDALEIVRWASRDMKFLLDDIVFSTISLFDYFANLIGLSLLGYEKRNTRWGVLVGEFKRHTPPIFRTGSIALRVQEEWIKGLSIYRHSLIHVESDTAGAGVRYDLTEGRLQMEAPITAPQSLVNSIQHLRSSTAGGGLRVGSVALWLAGQTFDTVSELIQALRLDLAMAGDN